MSPAPLVFLDLESTGLDPDRHEPRQIAVVVRGHRDPGSDGEWVWQLKPDLELADPAALRIGRYYAREQVSPHGGTGRLLASPWLERGTEPSSARAVAERLAVLLDGAYLIGAVPSFDAGFLDRLLRRNAQCPTWHYRLVCVETLTAGHFGRLVGGLADCARELGVPVDPEVAHTALGDARLARDIYDAVMGEAKGAALQPPAGGGSAGGVSINLVGDVGGAGDAVALAAARMAWATSGRGLG